MPEETTDSAWNLAQGFMFEIKNSLARSTNYYISKRFDKGFACLVAAKMRIEGFLNDDEEKEFKKKEEAMDKLTQQLYFLDDWDETEVKKTNLIRAQLKQGYEEYNNQLMKALKKYKISIPEKEDEGMF